MESILKSIKTMIPVEEDCAEFDDVIIIHINSALMRLNQLGVGPTSGFRITGATETWNDFLGGRKDLEAVKDYVYLRVKLKFDPPQNSFMVSEMQKAIEELDWTLNHQAEME